MISHAPDQILRLESQLRALVEQHRQIEDEPLALALAYAPEGESRNLYLLEVIEKPGHPEAGFIADEGDLFEVEFASTEGFPMELHQRLHLILTNPVELPYALEHDWPAARGLRGAVREGRYLELFVAPGHDKLLEEIRG
jgi:hypothetical protein